MFFLHPTDQTQAEYHVGLVPWIYYRVKTDLTKSEAEALRDKLINAGAVVNIY